MKKICVGLSMVISLPIFISNIFVFGKSTYSGYTKDSFISWFSLPFNATDCHPRYYATKFFFKEGNTIGILMLIVLPFLYYFLYKEKNKNKRVLLSILIVVQTLSMIILSTRLATYFSAIIPVTMLVIYIILILLKSETLKKWYIAFLVFLTIFSSSIIPFSPAYQNQLIDAADYQLIKNDEAKRNEAKQQIREKDSKAKWSDEWLNYYTYMFEEYAYLINVTPSVYYKDLYDYKYDPGFWVHFIFDYELEERVNGRQVETIFTKYKWDELTNTQKLTGLGYGTFMRGGIIIERDFIQQYYSYGLIGFLFLMAPWIILLLYACVSLILGFKKNKWNYLNITLLFSISVGYLCACVSGHTLDEFSTSMFISLCIAYLLKRLKSSSLVNI